MLTVRMYCESNNKKSAGGEQIQKTIKYYSAIQSQQKVLQPYRKPPQDIVVNLKSPRRRREKQMYYGAQEPRDQESGLLAYCGASILQTYRATKPRIRALSLVRGEYTTNVQSHETKNPGS